MPVFNCPFQCCTLCTWLAGHFTSSLSPKPKNYSCLARLVNELQRPTLPEPRTQTTSRQTASPTGATAYALCTGMQRTSRQAPKGTLQRVMLLRALLIYGMGQHSFLWSHGTIALPLLVHVHVPEALQDKGEWALPFQFFPQNWSFFKFRKQNLTFRLTHIVQVTILLFKKQYYLLWYGCISIFLLINATPPPCCLSKWCLVALPSGQFTWEVATCSFALGITGSPSGWSQKSLWRETQTCMFGKKSLPQISAFGSHQEASITGHPTSAFLLHLEVFWNTIGTFRCPKTQPIAVWTGPQLRGQVLSRAFFRPPVYAYDMKGPAKRLKCFPIGFGGQMETKKWSYWLTHLVAPTTSCPPSKARGRSRHWLLHALVTASCKAWAFIAPSCWLYYKEQQTPFGEVGGKKKRLQQCEENFLSVKNILCSACGSTQGMLFTVPASPTYYTAGSGATIRVQLITW